VKYAVAVRTLRGEVLVFPEYSEGEYLTAVSVAREQSRHSYWTEVREGDKVCVRYQNGYPSRGQSPEAWKNDRLSHLRRGGYSRSQTESGWDDQWP
jgi:hypothetical protein